MKSIPEISVDTKLLAQVIEKMEPGHVLTYEELSSLIGRDVRKRARGNLRSARLSALRSHGVVTEAVTSVGIKRLEDTENVGTTGDAARRRIRRLANRAVQKLTAVNFDELTNDLKIKQNTELSQLGALRAFSRDAVSEKIAAKVAASNQQLAIAKTLEVFSGEKS
jgi:hypothetical protein